MDGQTDTQTQTLSLQAKQADIHIHTQGVTDRQQTHKQTERHTLSLQALTLTYTHSVWKRDRQTDTNAAGTQGIHTQT